MKLKRIPLTQGKYALVDDEDYGWLIQWKWHIHTSKNTPYTYYAVRYNPKNPKQQISMHRLIMNVTKEQRVDHKNRNGWDNRRSNLRFCTPTENNGNRIANKHSSKYKGVGWYSRNKRWRARITFNKKQYFLGHFENENEAARAYNKGAVKYFGEFARLNDV